MAAQIERDIERDIERERERERGDWNLEAIKLKLNTREKRLVVTCE